MSDISVSVGLETKDAKKASADYIKNLEDIVKAAEKLETQNRKLNKVIGLTSKAMGNAVKKQRGFASSVDRTAVSLESIHTKVSKATQATELYDKALDAAAGSNRKVTRTIEKTNTGLEKQTKKLKETSKGWKLMRTAMAAIGAAAVARGLINIATSLDSIRASMGVVFGDSNIAEEFKFITDESLRLGLSLKSSAKDYTSLAAATKNTSLEGEQTRDIFIGISEAGRALSLTTSEVNRAMTAVNQILSKGKVSAEELRGQLGEVLPGAFQIAARATGTTTAELSKMLELGQVISEDFMPKFIAQLRFELPATSKSVNTLSANFARAETRVTQFADAITKGGFGEALKDVVQAFGEFIGSEEALEFASNIGAAFRLIGDGLISLLKALPSIVGAFNTLVDALEPLHPLLQLAADNLDVIVSLMVAKAIAPSVTGLAGSLVELGGALAFTATILGTSAPAVLGFIASVGTAWALVDELVNRADRTNATITNSAEIYAEAMNKIKAPVEDVTDAANIFNTAFKLMTEFEDSSMTDFSIGLQAASKHLEGAEEDVTSITEAMKRLRDINEAGSDEFTNLSNQLQIAKDRVTIYTDAVNTLTTGTDAKKYFDDQQAAVNSLIAKYKALTKSLTPVEDRFAAAVKQLKETTTLTDAQTKAIKKEVDALNARKVANAKAANIEKDKSTIKAMQARIKAQKALLEGQTEGLIITQLLSEEDGKRIILHQELTDKLNEQAIAIKAQRDARKEDEEFLTQMDKAIESTDTLSDSWSKLGENMAGGFGGAIKELQTLASQQKTFSEKSIHNQDLINKAQKLSDEGNEEATKRLSLLKIEQGELDSANTVNRLGQLSQVASAMSSGFEEGSEAARAFTIASNLAAAAQAVAAIATQGLGDPYTAFARIAAMIGTMASLGISVKGGGGSSSGSATQAALDTTKPITGGVLGSPDDASDSINKAFKLIEEADHEQNAQLHLIHRELQKLNNNIAGLVVGIVKSIATGDLSFEDLDITGSDGPGQGIKDFLTDATNDVGDFLSNTVGSIFGDTFGGIFDDISGAFIDFGDNLLGGLIDGLFGGGIDADVISAGIQIATQSFESLRDGINAATFQIIQFEEDGGWFGSDDEWVETHLAGLSSDIRNNLTNVVRSIGSTVMTAVDILGVSTADSLDSFLIPFQRIQTKGRSTEEIQKDFENLFSAMGDSMVEHVLPSMLEFQRVGEALFETLSRVVQETVVFENALLALGIDVVARFTEELGSETTARDYFVTFTQRALEAAGGLDAFLAQVEKFATEVVGLEGLLGVSAGNLRDIMLMEMDDIGRGIAHSILGEGFDGGTLQEFVDVFEVFKDFLSPEQVVQWVEAGNALSDLNKVVEEFEKMVTEVIQPYTDLIDILTKDIDKLGSANDSVEESIIGVEVASLAYVRASLELASTAGDVEILTGLAKNYADAVRDAFTIQSQAIAESIEETQSQIDIAQQLRDKVGNVLSTIAKEIQSLEESAPNFDVAAARASELDSLLLQMFNMFTLSTQEQIDLIDDTHDAIMKNYSAQKSAIEDLHSVNMIALEEAHSTRLDQEQDLADLYEDRVSAQIAVTEALAAEQAAAQNAVFQEAFDSTMLLFEAWNEASQSLNDFLGGLDLSSVSILTPEERLAASQATFESTLAAAQGGDADAAGRLAEASQGYLEEARAFFASSDDYTSIFNLVKASVSGVAEIAAGMQAPELLSVGDEAVVSALDQANENLAEIDASILDLVSVLQDGFTSDQLAIQMEVAEQANLDALEALRLLTLEQLSYLNETAATLGESLDTDLAGYQETLIELQTQSNILTGETIQTLEDLRAHLEAQSDSTEQNMRDIFIEQSGIDSFNTDRTIVAIDEYTSNAQAYYDQYYALQAEEVEARDTSTAALQAQNNELIKVMRSFVEIAQGGGGGIVTQGGSDGISSL